MNEQKQIQIKEKINFLWEDYEDKVALAKHIEYAYIFGDYADNEHYSIDEITNLIKEVDLEKNPLPEPEIVEVVVEEPLPVEEE
jgi:hypothetical protein